MRFLLAASFVFATVTALAAQGSRAHPCARDELRFCAPLVRVPTPRGVVRDCVFHHTDRVSPACRSAISAGEYR
jgi:hypothetical protein